MVLSKHLFQQLVYPELLQAQEKPTKEISKSSRNKTIQHFLGEWDEEIARAEDIWFSSKNYILIEFEAWRKHIINKLQISDFIIHDF